jgi:hypothetical protein
VRERERVCVCVYHTDRTERGREGERERGGEGERGRGRETRMSITVLFITLNKKTHTVSVQ